VRKCELNIWHTPQLYNVLLYGITSWLHYNQYFSYPKHHVLMSISSTITTHYFIISKIIIIVCLSSWYKSSIIKLRTLDFLRAKSFITVYIVIGLPRRILFPAANHMCISRILSQCHQLLNHHSHAPAPHC